MSTRVFQALLPLVLVAALALPAQSSAADRRASPALGTLPATDHLDEWEQLSRGLTIAETLSAGIMGGIATGMTIGFLAEGLPTDSMGWLAIPIAASFGLGSVTVGTARGINLRKYEQARARALAEGRTWDGADLAQIRRWQAREQRAVGAGMLIYAGISAALLTAWNLADPAAAVGEDFARSMQFVFVVGLTVDLAAGSANLALARRELYWLDR